MWTSYAQNGFQMLTLAQADLSVVASFGRYFGLARDIESKLDGKTPANWVKETIAEPVASLPDIEELAYVRTLLNGIVAGRHSETVADLEAALRVSCRCIFDAGPRILDPEALKKFETMTHASLFPPATMRSMPSSKGVPARPSMAPKSIAPRSTAVRTVVPPSGQEDNISCGACNTLNEPTSSYCKACGTPVVEEVEYVIEDQLCTGTVMFADLKGFTKATDGMSPQETMAFVNSIFAPLREVAIRHGGRVNKYMGDNMMVVFGPPFKYENHEERALRCALEIVEVVKALDKGVEVRVGLNSGDYLMGEIGKNLDVIGPMVNVASRCESLKLEELNERQVIKLQDESEVWVTDLPLEGLGTMFGWQLIGEVMADVGERRIPLKVFHRPKPEDTLQDKIPAGNRVIATDRTLIRLGDLFETQTIGEVPVKGVSHPVTMYNVVRANPAAQLARARSADDTVFLGRDREMAQLVGNFGRADRGWPRFVSVLGEAGQGKSRLATEFYKKVGEGREIERFETAGVEREAHPPYYYIAEMFRRAAQFDIEDNQERKESKVRALTRRAFGAGAEEHRLEAELLGYLMGMPFENPSEQMEYLMSEPAQLRGEIQRAVLEYFIAFSHKKTLVLEFEDIQWADEESLRLIHEIFERIDQESKDGASHKIIGLALARPEFAAAYPDYFNGDYAAAPIKLSEMSAEGLHQVACALIRETIYEGDLDDIAAFLVKQCGGNVYLLHAMARAVRDDWLKKDEAGVGYYFEGPNKQTIGTHTDSFLQARIEHLSKDEQYLLQAAAVLGDDISFESLSALGVPEPATLLRSLIDKEIMRQEGDNSFEFRHALLRENVNKRLNAQPPRKAELHKRAADYLIAAESAEYALIAIHLELSQQSNKAAEHYLAAANRSKAFGLFDAGINYFRKVNALSANQQDQLESLCGWAECLIFNKVANRKEQMMALLPKFDGLEKRITGDKESLSRIHHFKGLINYYNNEYRAAEKEYLLGLSYYPDSEISIIKCRLLNSLGGVFLAQNDEHERAIHCFEQARDDSKLLGNVEQLGLSLTNISRVYQIVGNYSQAFRSAQEAIRILSDGSYLRQLLLAMNNAGSALMPIGAYDEALKILRAAIRLSEQKMSGYYRDFLLTNVGEIERLSDDIPNAERSLSNAFEEIKAAKDTFNYAINALYRSLTYADMGELDQSISLAHNVVEVGKRLQQLSVQAMGLFSLARTYYKMGNWDKALQSNEAALSILDRVGAIPEFDLPILYLQALIHSRMENIDKARVLIERANSELMHRAAKITEAKHRVGFLKADRTNADIQRLHQILKNNAVGLHSPIIGRLLSTLNWYIPRSQPSVTSFVDPATDMVQLSNVSDMKDVELNSIIRADDSQWGTSQAGIVVDISLPAVFHSMLTSPIELKRNPGDMKEVWADNGYYKPFMVVENQEASEFDAQANEESVTLHVFGQWTLGFDKELKEAFEMAFKASGRSTDYRVILKDRIYTLDGLVYIELQPSSIESVESVDGDKYDAPSELQPKPEQFGQLKFIFEALDDNRTRIVFDFENSLFTRNPRNFLREAIRSLAAYAKHYANT